MTDSGPPEVRASSSLSNGLHSEPVQRASMPISSSKNGLGWDEDWGSITKGTTTPSVPLEPNQQPLQQLPISQPSLVAPTPLPSSASMVSQQTPSCTPVNIEWPPPISSAALTSQLSADETQKHNPDGISGTSFDDLDPFANWPPRPGNSSSSMGSVTKSTNSHVVSGPSTNSLGFGSNKPIGLSTPYQGSLVSGSDRTIRANMNMQAIGISNQGNASSTGNSNSTLGMGYANANNNAKRSGDLGSIFASSNSGNPTPRLAPPPTTAIGRRMATIGRGRGRNQASRSGHANKISTEQPPLLDLL